MNQDNHQNQQQQNKLQFIHTMSCPNCPVVCYSYKGALTHAERCYGRRRLGLCCLCKKENPYEVNKPDYYSPENERYWHICLKCYEWVKRKGLCL